jgi:hypothetical protein
LAKSNYIKTGIRKRTCINLNTGYHDKTTEEAGTTNFLAYKLMIT